MRESVLCETLRSVFFVSVISHTVSVLNSTPSKLDKIPWQQYERIQFVFAEGCGGMVRFRNSPEIVPCTVVPFLSSMVTVSFWSFMRNLSEHKCELEKGDWVSPRQLSFVRSSVYHERTPTGTLIHTSRHSRRCGCRHPARCSRAPTHK